MMDVTVYWNERGKHPHAVEKHSTPLVTAEGAWDCLRLSVMDGRAAGYEKGVWMLAVEAFHPGDDGPGGEWRFTHDVIAVNSGTEELFFAFLEDNVDAINVDGYPWWVAKEDEA